MSEINNLPKHWQIKKLGEVCFKITDGSHFSPNSIPEGYPYITVKDIKNDNKIDFENCLKISKDDFEKLTKNDCKPLENDVLFSKDGTVGKVSIINYEKDFVVLSSIAILRPNRSIVDSKYLFHILKSSSFLRQALDQKKGIAIRRIILRDLKELEFQIPPISEQVLVVSKIEELLSDLENGKQQLQIAQQQLKIYRQSLLKWAFEGKLTNKNVKDGELPKGWKWVILDHVCHKIGDIDHKMPKQLSSGYPYVSTKDFTDNLKISFDNAKYISKEDYTNLSRKIKPENGDIIFPRYGTIGKNILIDFDKEFLVSYSCAVVKPNQNLVLSKYVYLYTLSPKITEEIRKYTVETTQANVGIASIKSFVFPLPTLKEQQLIVDELESKLTVCDKIEETINQSLQQAETLRQSILKKAFEGKLV